MITIDENVVLNNKMSDKMKKIIADPKVKRI